MITITTDTRLRLATLSYWHVHAADYSARAQQEPEVELTAVWDEHAERGAAAAQGLGVPYVSDLAGLLADPALDGVIVTTPTRDHREVILAALRAGKHVFTEKLLAPTLAACEEITAVAAAADLALVVSLPRRDHGYARTITARVRAGEIGEVTRLHIRMSHDGALRGWLPERFFDAETAIGGALTDLGCHPVYLAVELLGMPSTVSATYGAFTGRALEDHAAVTLGYPDGRIAVLETGFVDRTPLQIEVGGTEGGLRYSDLDKRLWARRGAEPWQQEAIDLPDATDPFGTWIECIRTGARAQGNVDLATDLTRVVTAANESAETGHRVVLSATSEEGSTR